MHFETRLIPIWERPTRERVGWTVLRDESGYERTTQEVTGTHFYMRRPTPIFDTTSTPPLPGGGA